MLNEQAFEVYWSAPVLTANFFVLLHLLGALALGLLVGYERTYHGRAAGMRTYGLVCMASAALTVVGAYSRFWYGGSISSGFGVADVTRVIQGILTGIGFLCAGVIMKEGFNISGLTTAASLWAASIIGVLVGVGFYLAAMSLAVLSAVCMVWMHKLENWLPSRQAVAVTLKFKPGIRPAEAMVRSFADAHGFDMADGTVILSQDADRVTWNFIAVARSKKRMETLTVLGREIGKVEGLDGFHLAYARN